VNEFSTLDAAEVALRQRQGDGARYDSPSAPAQDLTWARRGTAYFARVLNGLSDNALDEPSLIPGWTRRHVTAHVAYQARHLAQLIEEITDAAPAPHMDDIQAAALVEEGSTLPARALRNLFYHTEVHLNVGWRDLSDTDWDRQVRFEGKDVKLAQTPWLRARSIWIHSVDLAGNGSFLDIPPALVEAMLAEISDRGGTKREGMSIIGAPADMLRWLAGRGVGRSKDVPDASHMSLPSIHTWPPLPLLQSERRPASYTFAHHEKANK
jgi:maleylpyruvate isomerase